MEKNTRIIIGAVIILFIAMISFRFDTLTGMAGGSEDTDFETTAVLVTEPGVIYNKVDDSDTEPASRRITVTVTSENWLDNRGKGGACFIWEGKSPKGCTQELCGSSEYRCKNNVFSYRIPVGWPEGDYQIRVEEYEKLRKFSKFVYGGEFKIVDRPEPLKNYDKYDFGKITV